MSQNNLYSKPVLFSIVATVVVLVGTIATMVLPMFTSGMHPTLEGVKPYTAIELAGKDIYQREGCVTCHTQTVRPLKVEVERYTTYRGAEGVSPVDGYSKAGEFAYDRPFLWGSKRTGPDLARVALWYNFGGEEVEMLKQMVSDPQEYFQDNNNMPQYKFLNDNLLKPQSVAAHMRANGFPYTEEEITALGDKTEMDALVAYLLTLGRALKEQ